MAYAHGPKAVYGLVDPRDGTVRYVGASMHPEKRYAQHIAGHGATLERSEWLAELRAAGLRPDLRIFAEPTDDWQQVERDVQDRHAATVLEARVQRRYALRGGETPLGLDVRPALARALHATRVENGLSRSEVASRLGKTVTTVGRWETGERTPDVNDLVALAMTYDTEPSRFLPTKDQLAQARRALGGEE